MLLKLIYRLLPMWSKAGHESWLSVNLHPSWVHFLFFCEKKSERDEPNKQSSVSDCVKTQKESLGTGEIAQWLWAFVKTKIPLWLLAVIDEIWLFKQEAVNVIIKEIVITMILEGFAIKCS